MKVNFKVKMKVTIEFLVEIYFRNDLHFFEKYFTWGNIQPSRDFMDPLYVINHIKISISNQNTILLPQYRNIHFFMFKYRMRTLSNI